MRIKICGITKPEQGKAIASFGATALGFICVPTSPRYVNATQMQAVIAQLPASIDRIGVFANTTLKEISQVVAATKLTGVQLHGDESPAFCHHLRSLLPDVEIVKALRIRDARALEQAAAYTIYVDTLLLDAYDPQQLGGTGRTLDWRTLQQFQSSLPWFLAGGLTPDNIATALTQLRPHGIDLSSGVERSPGDKDLDKIARLFEQLRLSVNSYQ
jgi:phosphoribosylanthranilate isomerase